MATVLNSNKRREVLAGLIADNVSIPIAVFLVLLLFVPTSLASKGFPNNQTSKRNEDESILPQSKRDKGADDNQRVRIDTQLVSFMVTVTDSRGRFVSGLTKDSFQVYDDGVKQEIAHFSDEDAPVSLGIVSDVSGSMKDRMKQSIAALRRFVDVSHQDDDLFLITFNDRPTLSQDFTTSGNQILESLKRVPPRGSTALYDAVYLAVEKVQRGRHPRKAILIISDGEDNQSRYNSREIRERVRESDVQIYAIGLTDAFSEDLNSSKYGRALLETIAGVTGGRAFFPNAYHEQQIVEICARIAIELRSQYSIGFYPSSRGDGTWHRIQVKLKMPKGLGRVSIRHREGYPAVKR